VANFIENIGRAYREGRLKPAVLVDVNGFQADASLTSSGPALGWTLQAQVPLDLAKDIEGFSQDIVGASAVIDTGQGFSLLTIVHNVGQWEHRLLLPLVGPSVHKYLQEHNVASQRLRLTMQSETGDVSAQLECPGTEDLSEALAAMRAEASGIGIEWYVTAAIAYRHLRPDEVPSPAGRESPSKVLVSSVELPEVTSLLTTLLAAGRNEPTH
jgi:hypothetical protein